MNNEMLVEIIKDKLSKQKMSAECKLQLNKIVEMEDMFVKDFSKEKWKEYFDLDIEKGQLQNLEIDQILYIAIEFIKGIKI